MTGSGEPEPGEGQGGEGEPEGSSRRRRQRVRIALVAAGILAYGLFLLLSRRPDWVEAWYASGVGPVLTRGLAALTAPVPFPVAELVILAFVGRQLHGLWRGVGAWRAGDEGPAGLLRSGALRVAADAGAALVLFYVVWGFHYARPPLEERMALPDGTRADAGELATLADEAVVEVNRAYRELHGTDDAGRPTRMPEDAAGLARALQAGWKRTAGELDLPPAAGVDYGPVKSFWPSPAMAYLGISGFFFPWTGEPVLNASQPAATAVRTMVHEMAHRRGYAPEDDANFLAFLVASRSPDPLARYSAWFRVHLRILGALRGVDREAWEEIRERRSEGVVRDIRDVIAYNERYRGWMSRATRRVNHAYLRSQRVEGGIASYGMVTRLLVSYARTREGRLAPGLPAPDAGG